MKLDLTSVAFVLPYKTEGDTKYIVYSHSFIPSWEKLHEHISKDKQPYDAWERNGFLTVTETPIVDQNAVMKYVIETCEANEWKIQCLCFDPAKQNWRAA